MYLYIYRYKSFIVYIRNVKEYIRKEYNVVTDKVIIFPIRKALFS